MPVQLPNLDDLTYEELVNEAKSLIPIIYPEWTDHNPSEPGIILIELLAWLTEMVIYRTDQVTEEHYRAFTNLINPISERMKKGDNLNSKIRETIQNLNKRYRMVTIKDFEKFVIEKWPETKKNGQSDSKINIMDTAEEIEKAGLVSKISRVKFVPNRDYRGHTKERRHKHAPAHISAVVLPEANRRHQIQDDNGEVIYRLELKELCKVVVQVDWKRKNSVGVLKIESPNLDETFETSFSVIESGSVTTLETSFLVTESDLSEDNEWKFVLSNDKDNIPQGKIKIAIFSNDPDDKEELFSFTGKFKVQPSQIELIHIVVDDDYGEVVPLQTSVLQLGKVVYFMKFTEPCRVVAEIEWDEVEVASSAVLIEGPDKVEIWGKSFSITESDLDKGDEWKFVLSNDKDNIPGGTIRIKVLKDDKDKKERFLFLDHFEVKPGRLDLISILRLDIPGEINAFAEVKGQNSKLLIRPPEDTNELATITGERSFRLDYSVSQQESETRNVWVVSLSSTNENGEMNYLEKKRRFNLTLIYPPVVPSQALTRAIWHYMNKHRLVTTRHHVVGPEFMPLRVEAKLFLRKGHDPETVVKDAQKALRVFYDPFKGGVNGKGWPFGRDIYVSEIYEILEGVLGVDYITEVDLIGVDEDRLIKENQVLVGARLVKYELIAVDSDFEYELPELKNRDQIKKGWRVEG